MTLWKPETPLCYMPERLDLVGVLAGVAVGGVRTLDSDLLLAKLEGRFRGMWMKTG